ncbi:outer membrane protein [Bradyrhizobium sp. HKCCYLS20291]|uniref:outer membrane protein n=1 Tax=Bradyrhizobium sp. HKCCYLS20291 TaxID=3420766 RepID=UPI003EB9F623
MRRVFGVCLCLSTFAGSTTSVWATDLALPPPLPPPDVFAYRWSGCHAGANAGIAWSRQQQAWNQGVNGVGAPAAPGQPVVNPPVVNPPVVNPPPKPPPKPNNPGGNHGGWKPPHKPPVYGDHGGWWQPDKHHHGGKDKDHAWDKHDHKYDKPDHDDGDGWPHIGKGGGYEHADHGWPWQAKPYKGGKDKDDDKPGYKDEKYAGGGWFGKKSDDDHDKSGGWSQLRSSGYSDRYDWLRHDHKDDHDKPSFVWAKPGKGEYDKYAWLKPDRDDDHDKNWQKGGYQKDVWQKDNWKNDNWQKDNWPKDGWQKHDHGGWAWKPMPPNKPGWPMKPPPGNNGGGQPPQNPPPGGGGVLPLPVVALQIPASVATNNSDVVGGIQLGCDYQVDRFVVGIQAMADLGITNASTTVSPQLTLNSRTSNLYTATLRAGYLVTPEVLLYARGGAAWTRTGVTATNAATGASASVAFNRSGWTVGAGAEWMFARNWSAFAEYDYADFGTVTGTLPGAAAVTGGPNVVSQKTQIHTALIGVNYHFGTLSRGR